MCINDGDYVNTWQAGLRQHQLTSLFVSFCQLFVIHHFKTRLGYAFSDVTSFNIYLEPLHINNSTVELKYLNRSITYLIRFMCVF